LLDVDDIEPLERRLAERCHRLVVVGESATLDAGHRHLPEGQYCVGLGLDRRGVSRGQSRGYGGDQ